MNNTSIILRREYLERVRKKSFIITTLLVPVLMLALCLLPTLIMLWAPSETKTVAVVDDSGIIMPRLQNTDDVKFISAFDSQENMLANDSVYGLLVIDRNIVKNNSGVRLLTPNAASVTVEQTVTSQMDEIIENEKLKQYNIANLDSILADVKTQVTLQSIRVDNATGEEESQSAALNSAMGTLLNFVLYMFILLYGSQVMTSIIEEKNNRVLELVVSSVKPMQLMLGKILGVGLVALTQIVIWGVIMAAISAVILPAVIPADVMAEAAAVNSGDMANATIDADIASAIGAFTNVGYVLGIFGMVVLFLIGGYLIYASIYAAIGAAVDNIQDASQLQNVAVMPIIIALVCSFAVIPDPNSAFAVVMSLIPFTSPMVMVARLPFGIASWQIVLSVAILAVTVLLTIWLAAKIYRVGIFMYGKKPTFRDLIRWARYK